MDIFTMDRNYMKTGEIEQFESAIWTDRYSGDGEVNLTVEDDPDLINILARGTLLGLETSDAPMIIETQDISDGTCKVTGISLPKWLNNRFLRGFPEHAAKTYSITNLAVNTIIRGVVALWATAEGNTTYLADDYVVGSPYPSHANMGIPNAGRLIIPGLVAEDHAATDAFGIAYPHIDYQFDFQPLYDAIRSLSDTYNIGLRITRRWNVDHYELVFSGYSGTDRRSNQVINKVIRFSPSLESLVNVKELTSFENYKNLFYGFAPSMDDVWAQAKGPGIYDVSSGATGFDLRADQYWSTAITQEDLDSLPWPAVGGPGEIYVTLMNHELTVYSNDHLATDLTDGEIPSGIDIQYGVNYGLGDIVEVEGVSGNVSAAMITEYIQSQDASGSKAYPTVARL